MTLFEYFEDQNAKKCLQKIVMNDERNIVAGLNVNKSTFDKKTKINKNKDETSNEIYTIEAENDLYNDYAGILKEVTDKLSENILTDCYDPKRDV